MSSSPATAPTPRPSPRIRTPRTTATTGFKYVMTSARPGPTSTIRNWKTTSASAVQTSPRMTSETTASLVGAAEGVVNAAGTANSAEAVSRLAQSEQAQAGRPLGRVEPEREQRDDQRHRRDQDCRQGRRDVLLAGRDERERQRDLHHRVRRDPLPAPLQLTGDARPPGEREQHRRAERHPHEGQEHGRDAVVHHDLDEEIRDAPDERHRSERSPPLRAHVLGRATSATTANPCAGAMIMDRSDGGTARKSSVARHAPPNTHHAYGFQRAARAYHCVGA
jgi:hypothetical protein